MMSEWGDQLCVLLDALEAKTTYIRVSFTPREMLGVVNQISIGNRSVKNCDVDNSLMIAVYRRLLETLDVVEPGLGRHMAKAPDPD